MRFDDQSKVIHGNPTPEQLAEQTAKPQPHGLPQMKHFGGRPGYCQTHQLLGCEICRELEQ